MIRRPSPTATASIMLRDSKRPLSRFWGYYCDAVRKAHEQPAYAEVAVLSHKAIASCFDMDGATDAGFKLYDALVFQDLVRQLRKVFLFRHLSLSYMRQLIQSAQVLEFKKGEEIIRQGDEGNAAANFY